jgi:hypothetical protein
MEYLLLVYGQEQIWTASPPAQMQEMVGAFMAYTQALKDANVLRGSNRLRPISSATAVRVTDGKTRLVDGPFAETKEQLGGYYLIDVPDLDAALSWAARCPAAGHGTVEVRPIWSM